MFKHSKSVQKLFSIIAIFSVTILGYSTLPVQAASPASPLYASGDFLWAKSMGGLFSDIATNIATDSNGNIYMTGFFSDTVDFDPGVGVVNLTSTGQNDIFVSKL